MRRLSAPVVCAVVAIALLAGCSPAAPSVSYPRYKYTCCAASDIQRVWHPGETMTLHWSSQSAPDSTDSATQAVTLTATLDGPYASVDSLKGGGSASTSLKAVPLSVDNGRAGNPISAIDLPAGLAPGFYNLTQEVASPGGSQSASTIIQVAPTGR